MLVTIDRLGAVPVTQVDSHSATGLSTLHETSSRSRCVRGGDGLPAGEIAAELGLPSATLSFQLSQLRHAGLVRYRRVGRSLIYAAECSAMNGLIGYLTEKRTLVLLFAFQGEQIVAQPLVIVLLAVPILIQVYLNSGIAYLLNRTAVRKTGGLMRPERAHGPPIQCLRRK